MMEIGNDQKFQILMAQLEERYGAAHKIRERCTHFTLWITGMAIGLAWLLINECMLSVPQRIALSCFTVALFGGVLFLLRGLLRGAATNRATLARAEAALGLYDKDAFLPDESILPAEYRNPRPARSHDCCTLVLWLCVVTASLLAIIWTAPGPTTASAPIIQTNETNTGGQNG